MKNHCVEILYEGSEENFIRYNLFIGDEDCSTFREVSQSMLYGPAHLLVKENCVNHDVKGFATALREAVKNFKCNLVRGIRKIEDKRLVAQSFLE